MKQLFYPLILFLKLRYVQVARFCIIGIKMILEVACLALANDNEYTVKIRCQNLQYWILLRFFLCIGKKVDAESPTPRLAGQ